MDASSFDIAASLGLFAALSLALGAHLVASLAHGRALVEPRVEREAALPLLGRAPMHAVYRAIVPVGRALVALGITANAITVASGIIAIAAAYAFATGHFGIAAAVASVAALADGLDGLVARIAGTTSRFGKVLDTTIDRYVDALFLGGIALHVHADLWLLALTLAAITGSFMVSYASSVERELGIDPGPAPMRRAHRLALLLLAAGAAPLAGALLGDPRVPLAVVFVAVGAIAVVGNVSAVRRLFRAALAAEALASERPPPPSSDPVPVSPIHANTSEAE